MTKFPRRKVAISFCALAITFGPGLTDAQVLYAPLPAKNNAAITLSLLLQLREAQASIEEAARQGKRNLAAEALKADVQSAILKLQQPTPAPEIKTPRQEGDMTFDKSPASRANPK